MSNAENKEEQYSYSPSIVERANQREDYKEGWCYARIDGMTKEIGKVKEDLKVSPQYRMFEIGLTPCSDNDPDTAVGRGMRFWQCLSFEPGFWAKALKDRLLANQLKDSKTGRLIDDPTGELQYAAWIRQLSSFARDQARTLHAIFPSEVPNGPRVVNNQFYFDGQPVDVDLKNKEEKDQAYSDYGSKAVGAGFEKALALWNGQDRLDSCVGTMVLAKLVAETEGKYAGRVSVDQLRDVDDPPYDKNGNPEPINTGDAVFSLTGPTPKAATPAAGKNTKKRR